MIAILFAAEGGTYSELAARGVELDVWTADRDATRYAGPWPVVAHPPCARWSRLAAAAEGRWGVRRGEDGGLFASALSSVRRWGGVLEHPADSRAWHCYDLPTPCRGGGWFGTLCGGWTCCVWQSHYGHPAAKATWLYAHGISDPLPLRWGDGSHLATHVVSWPRHRPRKLPSLSRRAASATPLEFALSLIDIAKGAAK